MVVDDHNVMYGGQPDALTVRVSFNELRRLLAGKMVSGENKSRGITVIIKPEENPKPISSS